LFSFDSGYSLVVLGKYFLSEKGGGKRGFYYHRINLHLGISILSAAIRYKKTRGTAMKW
jgi:hypothetical protein